MADVRVRVFADSKEAEKAFAALEQKLDKLEGKQKRAAMGSRRASQGVVGDIKKWGSSLAGVAAGYFSINAAISLVQSSSRELLQEVEEAARKFDTTFRKFRVQSGLRGLEGDKAQTRILDIAERNAFTVEGAGDAARQLVSSGFSAKEASGASLNEFLKVLSASNVVGEDVQPAELAQSVAQYLESQGLDKNATNLALVGRSVQGLFRGTDVQLPDLSELAKQASSFKGAMSVPEQLSTFSVLREVMPAAEATTGMRNIVNRLRTARETKGRVDALGRIGLSPDDVDFVGEDIEQVLTRLGGGLQGVPEKERAGILKKLFEERGVASAEVLIGGIGKIRDRQGILQDDKQFLSDVAESQGGRNAAAIRQQVRRERRRVAKDDEFDLLLEEAKGISEGRDESAFIRAISTGIATTLRTVGVDAQTAVGLGFGEVGDFNVGERAKEQVEALKTVNEKQLKIQEEQLNEMRKNRPPVARNVNRE